jgi:hypothetical protein
MICHANTPAEAVAAFTVDIERKVPDRVWIRYQIFAPHAALRLSVPAEPVRANGLWQTTCFEAFVRRSGQESYCELNFAPSRQWAAYSFKRYRCGMADLPMAFPPNIFTEASEMDYSLEAIFALPPGFAAADIEIGITGVIEEVQGTKSFWSLNHPRGAPDFHHPDCFVLRFPPPALP